MQRTRTRARFRRIPELARRTPGGRSGGTGGGGGSSGSSGDVGMVGLGNFSAANFMSTPGVGGEPGVASGFGWLSLVRLDSLGAATRTISARYGSSAGWQHYIAGTNQYLVFAPNNNTVATSFSFVPSDVGKLFLLWGIHSGPTNQIASIVNREMWNFGGQVGYTPSASPMVLGQLAGAAPGTGLTELAHLTFQGVPTAAQIAAFADAVRARGDVPESMAGATITHRHSLRDELRGTVVVDGQTAPAQLTDTITRAPVDALARQGSPVVRVIDAAIDGRRLLGAQGFSAANSLLTAPGKGILGHAAGFWVCWAGQIDVLANGQEVTSFIENYSTTPYSGYGMRAGLQSYADLALACVPAGVPTFVKSASFNLAAGDIGQPLVLLAQNTGTALQFWARHGGQPLARVGADVPIAGCAPSAQATTIGRRQDGTYPMANGRFFGAMGGDGYVLSDAEIADLDAAFVRAGRLQPVVGKTTRWWDITADTLASSVDAVPAVVLDRVGSDHLTRVDSVQTGPDGVVGAGPFGLLDGWGTVSGGGMQGAATGFYEVIDVWYTKVPTAAEMIAHCTPTSASSGWYLQGTAAAAIRWVTPPSALSPAYTITAGDTNKRTRFLVHRMASGGMQFWVNGVQVGGDSGAITFPPNLPGNPAAFQLGTYYQSQNFSSGRIESCSGGPFALTPAEIATLFADLTRPAPAIPGKTTKLHDFTQDVAGAGGQVLVRSVERISGGDDMVRLGSGLTLAQRTERLWSYEATPIMYGVNALTDADHYASTDAVTGNAAGCWFGVPFVIESQSVPSQTRTLIGSGAAGRGWSLSSAGTNSSLGSVLFSGSGAPTNGPVIVVAAADVGKLMLLIVSWDGAGKIHAYTKRAESGAGATMTGFTPALAADPFTLGRHPSNAQAASGIRILGCMGGVGVPSLAEVQAAHDAILAIEDLVEIPGKTDYLISIKQDALANGGALPTTLINRKGAGGLTKVGAPQLAPIYARAAAW
jgi:hypothetical protein